MSGSFTRVVMKAGHDYKDSNGEKWYCLHSTTRGWECVTEHTALRKVKYFEDDGTSLSSATYPLVEDLGPRHAPNAPPKPNDALAELMSGQVPYPHPVHTRTDTQTGFPPSRYEELLNETIEQIRSLGKLKGGEYAGDVDRLANFRRNAIEADATMELIWRIYVSKHWDAIMQYELDLRNGKERPRLEGLAGRADDIIVYMILFKCMLEERGVK